MIRIINNTDVDFRRLLVLYRAELDQVRSKNIEAIVFNPNGMDVFGIDELLLTVRD